MILLLPDGRVHTAAVELRACAARSGGEARRDCVLPAWQYITARVREEFPDALFLLEGLGGGWDDTENLLTEGGLQWAYSELFQEFSGAEVANYLNHALKQSQRRHQIARPVAIAALPLRVGREK